MKAVIVFLLVLFFPLVSCRGVWSNIPRKKGKASSSPPITSSGAPPSIDTSPTVPSLASINSELIEEFFQMMEEYLSNDSRAKEDGEDQIFELLKFFQLDENTAEGNGEEKNQEKEDFRIVFNFLNNSIVNIRSNGLDAIMKGREFMSESAESLTIDPTRFIESFQSFQIPSEVLQSFKRILPQIIVKIKLFFDQNESMTDEEKAEFNEMLQLFETLFQLYTEINNENIPSSILQDEIIHEDSINDLMKMFHDPKQMEEFRQMIIHNPQIAKEMLGVDETILARSEAFADYMNMFASEISSIMNPSHTTLQKENIKPKKGKKSKKSILTESYDS